jgi:alkanesulfonate monooxygenase SsuD/methylene tetrahydromethanopterin reductase-like flavin-dependent oxidoreductase (luciferase family)
MEFAIGAAGSVLHPESAKRAEALGFSHYGVSDGPLLFGDPFAFLALAARETSTINLGTMVANPLTRTPAALANSCATLNQIAPGRVFFGIGTANNALRSMGVRVARISELEDCIRVVKGLLSGARVKNKWLGVERDIQFIAPELGWYNIDDPVPIWQAAGGPKALAVAARHADYVIYNLGPNPDLIRLVRETLDREARSSGRDPAEIKLVGLSWFYLLRPGEHLREAIDDGFGNGAVISAMTNLPLLLDHREELGDRIVDFAVQSMQTYVGDPRTGSKIDHLEAYRTHITGTGVSPDHRALLNEYTVDYFCIYGDEDTCREKAQVMLDSGVDVMCVFLPNPRTYERDADDISRVFIQ